MKTKFACVLIFGLLLGACAKEKELISEVQPVTYHRKTEFKTSQLVRTIEEADSNNDFYAVPGFHYDFGSVKPVITERYLNFVAVGEADNRPETATVVASFPILEHFDIVRAKNDYQEDTNRIVEEKKRPWNEREYIRVDWSKPQVKSAEVTNQLWAIGRINEDQVDLVKTPETLADGTLRFTTESTISASGGSSDESNDSDFMGASYRVRMATYIVPQKASDFEAREYSNKEFARFGYFRNFENFSDPEKGPTDQTVKRYARIFNVCEAGTNRSCSSNRIIYHLSNGFPSEYRELAQKAVAEWNAAFQQALNRQDTVVVLSDEDASISDPRKNVIAFYPERTEAGLLGVSQTMNDSTSGETLAARSTVYGHGINMTRSRVEDVIDQLVQSGGIPGCLPPAPDSKPRLSAFFDPLRPQKATSAGKPSGENKISVRSSNLPGLKLEEIARGAFEKNKANASEALSRRKLLWETEKEALTPAGLNAFRSSQSKSAFSQVEELVKESEKSVQQKRRELKMASLGIHSSDFVEPAAIRFIETFAKKHQAYCGSVPLFKRAIKDEVAKMTFYTTLLHEMGHNFGLRHNFHASADVDEHYHPEYKNLKEKLKDPASGVKPEDLEFFAYTSVMDYDSSFYEVQGGLGPYDVAAIRFGYSRSLKNNDPVTSKPYQFCTDHQVMEDPLCQRHDKGQTVSLALINSIDRYQRTYVLTHFRRGRHDFGERVGSVLGGVFTRTMLPARQVLDELIYKVITSRPALPNQFGCTQEFFRASIAAGEIANTCDSLAAESAGVNVLDWSTFVNGLFDPATGEFLKDPETYIPGGFADMVLANALARNFFQAVIGAPEPGSFIPQLNSSQEVVLTRLPNAGSDEEKLRAFAEENQISNVDEFVKQALPHMTDIEIGRVGKVLESQVSVEAGYETIESIGYMWDKYLALLALGARYYGVEKYARLSMAGNAYLWPQGRKWTTQLIDALATEKPHLSEAVVTLRNGRQIRAKTPLAANLDLRSIAIMVGVADFATNTDHSFADKLRICRGSSQKCESSVGLETVKFESASGHEIFTASQLPTQDSIAFSLIQSGKVLSDQRKEFVKLVQDADKLRDGAKSRLNVEESLRKDVEKLLKSEEKIKKWTAQLTDSDGAGSVWGRAKLIAERLDDLGVFVVLNQRAAAMTLFNQAELEISKSGIEEEKAKNIVGSLQRLRKVLVTGSSAEPGVLDTLVQVKTAPILLERTSEELSRKEPTIYLIRRLMSRLALD